MPASLGCFLRSLTPLQPLKMIGPDIPAHLLGNRSTTPEDKESPEAGPSQPASIGPAIPPELLSRTHESAAADEEDDEDDYMPALPPDLSRTEISATSGPPKKVLGPSFPTFSNRRDDDDDDDDVGPMPLPAGYVLPEKDGVTEFLEKEERRRKQVEVSYDVSRPGASSEADKFL